MHQVRASADLDVALIGRGSESIEQPAGVLIRDEPVPLAANDSDRRLHLRWIAGKLPAPSVYNVNERACRDFHTCWTARVIFRISVELALTPFSAMYARQNQWSAR